MKNFIGLLIAILLSQIAYSQAIKPSIMVIPSDAFCITNGYSQVYENMGQVIEIADYKKALQNDPDLLMVIGKINTMMAERGFPLKNLETELKKINKEKVENQMLMSSDGASIIESPTDIIKRVAKADIIMQITYTINEQGPSRSVTFNLQGIDAYTSKQIAGAQGTAEPSYSADIPTLLEEAVLANIDNFSNQLQDYFDDIFESGREVIVKIKIWDNAPINLKQIYLYRGNDDELNLFIEDWISENSVNGKYSISDQSENMMIIEQVRIPLYYERNGRQRAMDTRTFINNLRKFLKEDPFIIEASIYQKGLGEAWLIIGEE
jgi:hypothetical protein